MERRTTRAIGALAAVGGVLSVLVWIPPRWYGAAPGDSYVFDPPTFGPLWFDRTVVPLLTVLAGAMLVVGVLGLVARDRGVASRFRRLSGYVAVAGLVVLEIAEIVFETVAGASAGGVGDLAAIGGVLVGLVLGGIGLLLAVPGMVALGVAYRRAGRPVVGTALVAGPVLTVVMGALFVAADVGPAGTLLLVAPTGLAFVAVGHELWTHPDPVPEPGR